MSAIWAVKSMIACMASVSRLFSIVPVNDVGDFKVDFGGAWGGGIKSPVLHVLKVGSPSLR